MYYKYAGNTLQFIKVKERNLLKTLEQVSKNIYPFDAQ